jgi:metal-sulfur cluster biosynthetic enzyme
MNLDPHNPIAYEGPQQFRLPIERALRRVVDPEVALSIVDVGLVYGVTVQDAQIHLRLTMTSAACPVTDVILTDVENELDAVLPPEFRVRTELVWEPPWSTERLSDSAKAFMGW